MKQRLIFFIGSLQVALVPSILVQSLFVLFMEGEESLLDSLFDMDNVEDMDDVDMVDVEEGEMVGDYHQPELVQTSIGVDGDELPQPPLSKRQRRRNKKNKKKKGCSESDVTDINRFVLNTCRHLKEKKSYLIWTAVGCLGVSALSDLVKEVDAIQACGGQKTADGTRYRFGGGILWSILKARDPNAFKEIMTKGKEFEKQFNKRDPRKAPYPNKQSWSKAEGIHAPKTEPVAKDENMPIEEKQMQKRPVHDRIRVPVSYDDLLEVENPKDEAI